MPSLPGCLVCPGKEPEHEAEEEGEDGEACTEAHLTQGGDIHSGEGQGEEEEQYPWCDTHQQGARVLQGSSHLWGRGMASRGSHHWGCSRQGRGPIRQEQTDYKLKLTFGFTGHWLR